MAYNGDSKKIVSSSFLYSTLQTFYTKIKGLLNQKANVSHTHNKADVSDFNKVLSNEDLDTIRNVGFYYASGGNTVINKPSNIDAFGLIVVQSANGWFTQLLYASNNSKQLYTRWFSGSWSSWTKETYIKDLSISGKTITYTKTDGTTGTITTQDTNTTYNLGSFGITATATELNTLDGITASVTELNYCDGVTSNIQTQLNGKASSSHSHNYAGSSSAGGAATTALTCTGNSVTSTTSSYSNNLNSTGFGNGTLTYLQTSGDFYDNTGWCHYIMANHGNGETYYNYTLGLPFWDVPKYQRQTGNTSAKSGWHNFYTTENITYGTSALTPGSSSLKTGHIYLQYE